MEIKTAGDLRGFLAEIMVGLRDGSVETGQAHAISKIAAQINQSLSVEVSTALQLERMGKDHPVAGSMLIGKSDPLMQTAALPAPQDDVADDFPPPDEDDLADGMVWCDQCDARVPVKEVAGCRSKFCSFKART